MQTFLRSLTRYYREYSLNPHIFKTHMKRTSVKLILVFILMMIIYSSFNRHPPPPPTDVKSISFVQRSDRTKPNAFIITENCDSLRFNATKDNIEAAFPNFFSISCYLTVRLNDSRVHSVPEVQKFSSNLLTFLDLWTYKIPDEPHMGELEWSFTFEDDVNFNNATQVSLPNFIAPLQELMQNPEIQQKHGFFYLGICGATFDNDSEPLISKDTGNILISQKGCGFCRHAMGITARRAELFWTEISSYRPDAEGSLDRILHNYCVRSQNHFYTFGTNFHFPPSTEHRGIAYQDRGRFSANTV